MPKNQICETKKIKFILFHKFDLKKIKKIKFFLGNLDFDIQGHPRSKVMMSNESLIMISYLTLIVTLSLTCSVSEIWSI